MKKILGKIKKNCQENLKNSGKNRKKILGKIEKNYRKNRKNSRKNRKISR